MKPILVISLVVLFHFSCKKNDSVISRNFSQVIVETVLQDSLLNVRAIEINDNRVVAATSNGTIYKHNIDLNTGFEDLKWFLSTDSLQNLNFRSLAFQGGNIFALSIGSPAKLFKDGRLVYYEHNPKAFYDSLDFWNDQEGIAIGDTTDECLSILITRDAGRNLDQITV